MPLARELNLNALLGQAEPDPGSREATPSDPGNEDAAENIKGAKDGTEGEVDDGRRGTGQHDRGKGQNG